VLRFPLQITDAATVRARSTISSAGEMSFSFLLRVFRGRQVSNP